MTKKLLLDACSLLCFFANEREADQVEEILKSARNNEVKLYMSLINYGEVCTKILQLFSSDKARHTRRLIKQGLSIQMLNVTDQIVERAAELKSGGGLAYPDAIALATAETHSLTVITKDKEFHKFANDFQIKFL